MGLGLGRIRRELTAVSWLVTGDVLARVVGQIAVIVTARLLGPAGYGSIALLLAILSVLIVLVDLGVGDAAVRDFTATSDGAARFRAEPHGVRLWLSLWCLPLGLVLLSVSSPTGHATSFALVALPFAVVVLGKSLEARAGRDFRRASMWAAALLLAQWLGGLGGSLVRPTADGASLGIVAALILISAVPVAQGLRERPAVLSVRTWAHRGRPFVVTAGAVALYSRGDRVVLAFIAGPAAAGPYAAVYGLVMLAAIAGSALHSALLPSMLRDFREPGAGAIWATRVAGLGAAMLPVALLVYVAAPIAVPALFGNDYHAGVRVLRWLTPLVVLYVTNPVLSSCLIASDRQAVLAKVAIANLITASVLYPVLVATYGAVGAAAASVAVESVGTGLCLWTVLHIASPVRPPVTEGDLLEKSRNV